MLEPTVHYRKTVYLSPDLLAQWDAYHANHPKQSFNGLVLELIKERLCATAAPTLITQ